MQIVCIKSAKCVVKNCSEIVSINCGCGSSFGGIGAGSRVPQSLSIFKYVGSVSYAIDICVVNYDRHSAKQCKRLRHICLGMNERRIERGGRGQVKGKRNAEVKMSTMLQNN